MKKVVFLLIIFCLVLYSCIIDPDLTTFYRIINQSSQDIKIRMLNYEHPLTMILKDTTFYVPKNQQLEFTYRGPAIEPFGSNRTDTAFIIFNNIDTVLYTRHDTSPRNILKKESYLERIENEKNGSEYYHYTYIFTEQDYQNAVNNKKTNRN